MAKYSKSAGKDVEKALKKMKKGTLKSGKSGEKVTDRDQAIAIGLSEAREKGKKVPKKKSGDPETKIQRQIGRGFLQVWKNYPNCCFGCSEKTVYSLR